MGILDEIGKAIGGGGTQAPAGGQGALLQAVAGMLAGGGLAGLVKSFQSKGLGDVIGSWVSTGQNLPISPDQVAHALGPDQLGHPRVEDHLTPATVPDVEDAPDEPASPGNDEPTGLDREPIGPAVRRDGLEQGRQLAGEPFR